MKKYVRVGLTPALERELQIVRSMMGLSWSDRRRQQTLSGTILYLARLGLKQYQSQPKYEEKLPLALYAMEHDNLLPYQVNSAEVDEILSSTFDIVE